MVPVAKVGMGEDGQLLQNMESLGFLASRIAHDLNNTLLCINGYAELAIQAADNNNVPGQYLDQVLKASQRASQMVRQILDFSRYSEPELKPVDLAELVHESLDFLSIGLAPNIEVSRQVTDIKTMVMADATQLHQVLMNLVTNASQAMSVCGGRLEVILASGQKVEPDLSAAWNLGAGPFAELTVRDQGPGIRPEIQEAIFQPFFTTKGPEQGCGLGLYTVQQTILRHKGAITVKSGEGCGTEIRAFLPNLADQSPGAD